MDVTPVSTGNFYMGFHKILAPYMWKWISGIPCTQLEKYRGHGGKA